jgi:solute:Na+ symporter, SSS family
MENLDWIIIALFFMIMLIIGAWSFKKVKDTSDFFVAGGKLPWWLSGISLHVSGYSGAVFVAYASLAYTQGISLYFWWAFTIAISTFAGAFFIAPKWSGLRIKMNIQSPTEYLLKRYNLATQQMIAWSGVLLKLFDVGAKWAAIGLILHVFTGTPVIAGILLSGFISLIYITIGGLWADVWTDFAQFVVQVAAGLTMFIIVVSNFGGISSLWNVWEQLPEHHSQVFTGSYTFGFALTFLFINFLSYNGGTWNLATRYISSPSGVAAKKAGLLSAFLYLVWPVILFFPMWMAPLILPGLEDPGQTYALLTQKLLPSGLIGLVLASMFANTMSMTSSDANTVSAVISRDILPNIFKNVSRSNAKQSLKLARLATVIFTAITLIIAIQAESFGGVLGLIISWYGALLGPIAIPMIFGLLPFFRYSDYKAAIASIVGGILAFITTKYVVDSVQVVQIASPAFVSLLIYVSTGYFNKKMKANYLTEKRKASQKVIA